MKVVADDTTAQQFGLIIHAYLIPSQHCPMIGMNPEPQNFSLTPQVSCRIARALFGRPEKEFHFRVTSMLAFLAANCGEAAPLARRKRLKAVISSVACMSGTLLKNVLYK